LSASAIDSAAGKKGKEAMEMSAPSFKDESSPLRASKNGSAVPSSSPFFLHTSSKLADSSSGIFLLMPGLIVLGMTETPRHLIPCHACVRVSEREGEREGEGAWLV
jgi:hypothetical protein